MSRKRNGIDKGSLAGGGESKRLQWMAGTVRGLSERSQGSQHITYRGWEGENNGPEQCENVDPSFCTVGIALFLSLDGAYIVRECGQNEVGNLWCVGMPNRWGRS